MKLGEAFEIVIESARSQALESREAQGDEDLEEEARRQREAIDTLEDFAVNHGDVLEHRWGSWLDSHLEHWGVPEADLESLRRIARQAPDSALAAAVTVSLELACGAFDAARQLPEAEEARARLGEAIDLAAMFWTECGPTLLEELTELDIRAALGGTDPSVS